MTKWELWKVSSFTWISWPVITLLMLKKTQGFWVKTQKPILFMPPGLPGGSDSKESTCRAGDVGSILGLGRGPWEGTAAAAAAAKSLQLCPTLCNPIDSSPPPSLGFSRQEHWSGLPFPSPMHESEKWKSSCSVVSDSSKPHGLQPTRLLHLWDFPGKHTGVGCHCLLREKGTTHSSILAWGIPWTEDPGRLQSMWS